MGRERVIAFSQDVYNMLKFFHVLGAVAWVGSGIFIQLEVARLRRTDRARLAAFARDLGFFGQRFFAPIAFATALLGIAIVLYGHLGFSTTWIWLGLVGF